MPSRGRTGLGRPEMETPSEWSVATSDSPATPTTAEVRITETTRPSEPTGVRSSSTMPAMVATPMPMLCQCSWLGDTTVLMARTTRFGPVAAYPVRFVS